MIELATCKTCAATAVRPSTDAAYQAMGHAFMDYRLNGDATCTEAGTATATCARCDATDTHPGADPLGHMADPTVEATVSAPGCTTQGYATYLCQRCGLPYQDDFVSATGHRPKHEADVAPTCTIRRYQKDRLKFFKGIMDIKLVDLTQAAIQQAVSLDAKRYAPKSIHCAHGLLSAALSVYLPDFRLKTILPQKVESDVVVPENGDIQRLLARVKGTRMECAILLGACCGLRRSEICGLKYEDVDRKKSTIQVRRTIVKDENGKWIVREATKTVKSKRKIEIAAFVIEKLMALPRESDFIINRLPDTISKDFIDIRDELGIKCRFHDLRHYNASIMLALNVPDKYAMERMGYSTPATLKKVYQHTMREKQQEVADTVNAKMNQLFSSDSTDC